MSKFNILLLTNRDSDNTGDQIIEATAIALIKAAMKNLGYAPEEFTINSRAAGMISKKYMDTMDPKLLESARSSISKADVIVFGGAPLFNYTYQRFYLRTIITLELAQEYNVPVLFSSIGVEPFDKNNEKSMALKKALELPCVRQITTRDDLESAIKYAEGTNIKVSLASDPAVFAKQVFDNAIDQNIRDPQNNPRIGLIVTRAGIFKDNGIDFTEEQQRDMWRNIMHLLTARGYDYKLFTTGHFSDEVFLDAFVRADGIPNDKVVFSINSPEDLINQINNCDGIIAYRLHANITSFSYDIPSVGLTWNFKVPDFYKNIGYPERCLNHDQWSAKTIVDTLETAIKNGVKKDHEYLMTVYSTLYAGLKSVFPSKNSRSPYSYDDLCIEIPRHNKTSRKQLEQKISRKLRRTYESYHKHHQVSINTGKPSIQPVSQDDKDKVIAQLKEILTELNRSISLQKGYLKKQIQISSEYKKNMSALQSKYKSIESRNHALLNSTSWRITKPIRQVKKRFMHISKSFKSKA